MANNGRYHPWQTPAALYRLPALVSPQFHEMCYYRHLHFVGEETGLEQSRVLVRTFSQQASELGFDGGSLAWPSVV